MKSFLFVFLLPIVLLGQRPKRLPDFPGLGRDDGIATFYNDRIFAGTGFTKNIGPLNDWWVYDVKLETWEQLENVPFEARQYVATFRWKEYLYTFGGWTNNNRIYNDLWRFNCNTYQWEEMTPMPGNERWAAAAFSIEDKAYVGFGQNDSAYFKDFWTYDIHEDRWQRMTDFEGESRSKCVSTDLNGFGVIGFGESQIGELNDFWSFYPVDQNWRKLKTPFQDSLSHVAFTNHAGFLFVASGLNTGHVPVTKAYGLRFYPSGSLGLTYPFTIPARGGANLIGGKNAEFYYLWGLDSNKVHRKTFYRLSLTPTNSCPTYFDLYPNISNESLLLSSSSSDGYWEVYDAKGQLLLTSDKIEVNYMYLNISDWRQGLYLIRKCRDCNCSQVKKFIKY